MTAPSCYREYCSSVESRPQIKDSTGNGVIQRQVQMRRIHLLYLVFETIDRRVEDNRRHDYLAGVT